MSADPRPCQCGHPYLSHSSGGGVCLHSVRRPEQLRICPCEAWTGQPSPDPILTVTQEPHEGRLSAEIPVVSLIWVRANTDEIGLELDGIVDRVPPERRQLAAALRDMADALDAQAAEVER